MGKSSISIASSSSLKKCEKQQQNNSNQKKIEQDLNLNHQNLCPREETWS